jgi:hypothetical protein
MRVATACIEVAAFLEGLGFEPPPPASEGDSPLIAMTILVSYAYGVADALAKAKNASAQAASIVLRTKADAVYDTLEAAGDEVESEIGRQGRRTHRKGNTQCS